MLFLAALAALTPTHLDPAAFDTIVGGQSVQLITLRHPQSGIETSITNYGARIVSLLVPGGDARPQPTDVVLGFDRIAPYMEVKQNFGACVGRYIGRIVGGRLSLDGIDYQLPVGSNGDTSHGGEPGFSKRIWEVIPASISDTTLTLRYLSPDGESGFPGRLDLSVTYTLQADGLRIDYAATTDRATVLNPSNHSFFNISGDLSQPVLDDWLVIPSDSIAAYNPQKRVTGRLIPVEDTPFDFRSDHRIGERIDKENAQLAVTGGYDHCYLIPHETPDDLALAAIYRSPQSGISMTVLTTEPAMQIYTANGHKGDIVGKEGKPYPRRNAICFETMHFPDSPNQPQWPSTALRPGEEFRSTTVFLFSF